MAKEASDRGDKATTPQAFAETTPESTEGGRSDWATRAFNQNTLLLGELKGSVEALHRDLESVKGSVANLNANIDEVRRDAAAHAQRIEGKLDAFAKNHGDRVHTLAEKVSTHHGWLIGVKLFLAGVGILVGWVIVYLGVPWIQQHWK